MMTPDPCLMCTQIPNGLKCTLHGGHMTKTEVQLRWTHEVVDERWVARTDERPPPYEEAAALWHLFRPVLDRMLEFAKAHSGSSSPDATVPGSPMPTNDELTAVIAEAIKRERPELNDDERKHLAAVILQAIRDAGYYIS